MRALAAAVLVAMCLGAGGAAATVPPQELIAFTSDRHWNYDEVWITSADGSRTYQTLPRFNDQYRAVGAPAWTPDHRRLAVATDRGIAILDLRGRMIRYAFRTHTPVGSSAWSPDARRLAVTLWSGKFDYLVVVRVKDGKTRRIGAVRGCDPSWSPDGKWIAFSGGCGDTPDGELGVALVHPDGTGYHRLGPHGSYGADWAPDGRTILWIRDSKVELHDVGPGTTTVLPLAHDASRAAFSPEGTRLVYEASELAACGEPPQEQDHYDGQLYVVPLAGGPERPIGSCEGDGGDRFPDW